MTNNLREVLWNGSWRPNRNPVHLKRYQQNYWQLKWAYRVPSENLTRVFTELFMIISLQECRTTISMSLTENSGFFIFIFYLVTFSFSNTKSGILGDFLLVLNFFGQLLSGYGYELTSLCICYKLLGYLYFL